MANFATSNVSVQLNNGNGTFAAAKTYATQSSPRAVVAADFNGDGQMDLAVANSGSNSVSILLNNGSGFTPAVNYAAGTDPYTITAADFTGDGKPDIAVANNNQNTVSVLVNIGDGAFNIQNGVSGSNMLTNPPLTLGAGQSPAFILSADFNGDGLPDLAVGNINDNTLGVLLNQSNAAPNLIANPGFELGNNASWTLTNAGITNSTTNNITNAHSGTFEGQSGNDGGNLLQTVTGLTPNTTYQLTVWINSVNKTTGGVQVRVDHDGTSSFNTPNLIPTTYTLTTVTFTTGANTTTANVVLTNLGNGTSFFDDLNLSASPLANPDFELGATAWNLSATGSSITTDPANAHAGAGVANITTDGGYLYQILTGLQANTTYQVTAWVKTIGKTFGSALLRVNQNTILNDNATDFNPGSTYGQTSVTFTTGTSTTTASLILANFGDGAVYFDDLALQIVPVGVANTGFESGNDSWNLSSTGASITTDPANARSGSGVAKITTDGGFLFQTLSGLTPNTTYQVAVWAKTADKTTGTVLLRVNHDNMLNDNAPNFIPGTNYVQTTVTFTTGASTTTATLILANLGDGSAYFDDVSVAASPLANPGFDAGTTAWNLSATGAAIVADPSNSHTGSGIATITTDGGYLYQILTGLTPNTTYQVTVWTKSIGKTTGTVLLRVNHDSMLNDNAAGFIPGDTYTQTSITFTTGASTTTANLILANMGNGAVYFDDLNLIASPLANPDFESGSASWNLSSSNTTIVNDPLNAFSGSSAAKITNNGGYLDQTLTGLQPNTAYEITVWAKTSSTSGSLLLSVQHDGIVNNNAANWNPGSAYGRTTVLFTTGASTTAATLVLENLSGGTAYFDDLTLAALNPQPGISI